jgi:hypothetical protein
MAGAASALLDSLDGEQRRAATWAFPSDEERTRWFYTPTDHGGLALAQMTAAQQQRTHQLLATGLSEAGYVTAAAIIGLENVLDRLEGWTATFGRERGRDPLLYWVAVFGTPGDDAWGWRFGGHHVSLNVTVVDGEVAATTPCFLGADPASAPLLGPHPHRPLAGAEDLGRELARSLDEDQAAQAVVSAAPPVDLVGGNRPSLSEGDQPLPLPLVWRGRFEGELDALLAGMQQQAEAQVGLTADDLRALAFSNRPKGIPASALSAPQVELLRALLDVYLDRLPDAVADDEQARFAGALIDGLAFLWAGGTEPGDPHYYRIQGADLLVEYDNTQRGANHVHTVWRDLRNDFGRDVLAQHYAASRH